MPGKQMSIDADLNAGLITPDEARARRRAIEREADFYGSMDGASKFVKGDAIAAIVIIVVNIVGGLTIGVAPEGLRHRPGDPDLHGPDGRRRPRQRDQRPPGLGRRPASSSPAAPRRTVSAATSAASSSGRPRLFMVVGGVLFVHRASCPASRPLIFFIAGGLVAGGGWWLGRERGGRGARRPGASLEPLAAAGADSARSDSPLEALRVETMELEVGLRPGRARRGRPAAAGWSSGSG